MKSMVGTHSIEISDVEYDDGGTYDVLNGYSLIAVVTVSYND